jgi:ankyrin repeat protein
MNIETIKQAIYNHPTIFSISAALILLTIFQLEFIDDQWRDNRGRSLLYLAAENGDIEKVKSLLKNTETPDQRDDCKWTPLMRAAQNRHYEVARILIDAGADVNARDKGGYSILIVASGSDNADILKLLIQSGASLNKQDDGLGWTALIWSAKEGLYKNVVTLLAAGPIPA